VQLSWNGSDCTSLSFDVAILFDWTLQRNATATPLSLTLEIVSVYNGAISATNATTTIFIAPNPQPVVFFPGISDGRSVAAYAAPLPIALTVLPGANATGGSQPRTVSWALTNVVEGVDVTCVNGTVTVPESTAPVSASIDVMLLLSPRSLRSSVVMGVLLTAFTGVADVRFNTSVNVTLTRPAFSFLATAAVPSVDPFSSALVDIAVVPDAGCTVREACPAQADCVQAVVAVSGSPLGVANATNTSVVLCPFSNASVALALQTLRPVDSARNQVRRCVA
jgi:hypothetical protein